MSLPVTLPCTKCFARHEPTRSHPRRPAASLSFKGSLGTNAAILLRRPAPCSSRPAYLQVENAITRQVKEERVAKLVSALENSAVAFGVRYNKVSVKSFEAFRRKLPEQAQLIVTKNTLLRVASQQVPGWTDIKGATKLENAWVFAPEEAIAASVKAFLDYEKALLEPIPRDQRAAAKPTDISGGVLDGKFYDSKALRALEKMPTKLELITRVAVMIKKVPTKVALSIKAVPRKLAYGVKALADGDDNKDLLVGDVFPKAPTS